MWVFLTASREEMFKNREMQLLFKKQKKKPQLGKKVKSGAIIVTVATLNLLKIYLIH